MAVLTGWAMIYNLQAYFTEGKLLLFGIGLIAIVLQIWMILEGFGILIRLRKER